MKLAHTATHVLSTCLLLLLFSAAGCSARAVRGEDNPPVEPPIRWDGSTPPARDAGSTDPVDPPSGDPDAGPTAHPDGGAPAEPPACDAPVHPLPAEWMPRCSSDTRTCLDACEHSECMLACVTADATDPRLESGRLIDCQHCLAWQQKVCIDRSGCHAESSALTCCITRECPDGSCLDTDCATEHGAWQTCATTTAAACLETPTSGEYYAGCFGD